MAAAFDLPGRPLYPSPERPARRDGEDAMVEYALLLAGSAFRGLAAGVTALIESVNWVIVAAVVAGLLFVRAALRLRL